MIFGNILRKKPSKDEKEALFSKQKGRCMYCGRKMTIHHFHVDHKMPISRGGKHIMSNLQLICMPCHGRKGNMSNGEFRRMYGLTPASKAKAPPRKVIEQSYFDRVKKDRDSTKKPKKQRSSWF